MGVAVGVGVDVGVCEGVDVGVSESVDVGVCVGVSEGVYRSRARMVRQRDLSLRISV